MCPIVNVLLVSSCVCLQLSMVLGQTQPRYPTTFGPGQGPQYNSELIALDGYFGKENFSWPRGFKTNDSPPVSKAKCKSSCDADATCKAFDYNFQYKECFLHKDDTCSGTSYVCPKCLNYKKISVPCAPSPTSYYEAPLENSHSLNGQRQTGTFSENDCLLRCYWTSGCNGVDYNWSQKQCWLHLGCSTTMNCGTCTVKQYWRIPNPCLAQVTSTVAPIQDPGRVYDNGAPGESHKGGIEMNGTFLSAPGCLTECTKNPNCAGVDFISPSCWWHTPTTSCSPARYFIPACVHYNNMRAVNCFVAPGTVPAGATTPASGTTAQPGIYSKYTTSFQNYVMVSGGTFESVVLNLEECLNLCDSLAYCEVVTYDKSDVCWLYPKDKACGPQNQDQGSVVYYHVRKTCDDPIFNDFRTAVVNKKMPPSEIITNTNLISCLKQCKTRGFSGVNFKQSDNTCELISQCGYLSDATNYVNYILKTVACAAPIFQDFHPVMANQRRPTTISVTSNTLEACLIHCKNFGYKAANYRAFDKRCELVVSTNQCANLVSTSGFVSYTLTSVVCNTNPIFQDFESRLVDRRVLKGVLNKGGKMLTECLQTCMLSSTCQGINFGRVDSYCEHVLSPNGCNTPTPQSNLDFYRRKNVNCGDGPTTPSGVTSAPSACWNKMKDAVDSCEPVAATTPVDPRDMINYCINYNLYVNCVIDARRTTDCPAISKALIINQLQQDNTGLRVSGIQVCSLFSNTLTTCLKESSTMAELDRCESFGIKPSATINKASDSDQCQKLRDYTDCKQSVVAFRCPRYDDEFYSKSVANVYNDLFSYCGMKSQPKITRMNTAYGPAAGRSRIIITGHALQVFGSPTLRFNSHVACGPTINESATYFMCKNRPRDQLSQVLIDQQLVVRLVYPNQIYYVTGTFTYKNNPAPRSLRPTKTVIGGNTYLTLEGSSLVYVVEPQFIVYRSGVVLGNPTICKVNPEDQSDLNERSLLCKVPRIEAPSIAVIPGRRVSQYKYETGFIFDGDRRYEKLASTSVRPGDMLDVYGPPDIDESQDRVFDFETFWPVNQHTVELSGRYLNTAATARDYTVLIGGKRCTNVMITETTITCEPPRPNPFADNETRPPIIVKAPGPQEYLDGVKVGVMNYQTNIFDNVTARYALIGGGVGVVVLFVILIVICCCCCECCADCCRRNSSKYSE